MKSSFIINHHDALELPDIFNHLTEENFKSIGIKSLTLIGEKTMLPRLIVEANFEVKDFNDLKSLIDKYFKLKSRKNKLKRICDEI